MIEIFIIVALVTSVVGGVATPVVLVLTKAYQEERQRLEAGGEPLAFIDAAAPPPRIPPTQIQDRSEVKK